MMNWFKKGAESGASPAFVRAVNEAAADLPGVKDAHEVSDYVTGGERPQVLTALTDARQRRTYGYAVAGPQPALYEHLGAVEPVSWVRWGQVLQATYGNSQWSTPLATAGVLPGWLEHLIHHLGATYGLRARDAFQPLPRVPVSFDDIAAVALAGGVDVADLLDALFVSSPSMQYAESLKGRRVVAATAGFASALASHLPRVGQRLTSGSVEQRLLFCKLVSHSGDLALARLAPMLAVAVTSTSAKVRDAAMPLVERVVPAAAPSLRELAVEGTPDTRAAALELLWRLGAVADRDFALETATADRAPRVRTLVDNWTCRPVVAPVLPPELHVANPAPIVWRVDVTPGLRACVERVVRGHCEMVERRNRATAQARALHQSQFGGTVPRWMDEQFTVDRHLGDRMLGELGSGRPPRGSDDGPSRHLLAGVAVEAASHPEASPVVVMKFLAHLGLLTGHDDRLSLEAMQAFEECHRRTGGPKLLTLQRMLDDMGLPGRDLVWRTVTSSWNPFARSWPAGDVWPYLARNIDFVIANAKPKEGDHASDDSAFYRLVGTMPAQHPALAEHLYAVALGLAKTHRAAAQDALRDHRDRTRRAAAALTDRSSEVRAIAATWLAGIADPDALPALEAAMVKEKHDVAKGALIDALEALGRPVGAYLDRTGLATEAETAEAKGLPAALCWVPWARLPALHWSDSGERVPDGVVRHLVAQATRAKSPEPNAMLRKYATMVAQPDRQRFAQALLESWIAADVEPISSSEAQQRAHQHATSMHQWIKRSPADFACTAVAGMTVEELTAHYLPSIARTPAGSQTSTKGVLAVVAAMGGREVVPPTEQYLRDWYVQRPAQGKALIAMLGRLQHPSATQLLLSIGSRFRTKGLQIEAIRQIEALAEREGWTVAELADRATSSAGFDANGRLELSYGRRSFVAQLMPDLGVEIRPEIGKALKSLPDPRQSDDPEAVKAAKEALTGAKKELRSLAPLLQQRLYEAMCIERAWPAQDWQRFLAGHPVMRLLCQRLLWVAEPVNGARTVFKLLEDGTLRDVDDEEVALPSDGRVRLAHDTVLAPEQVEAWLSHLVDHEVQPLFAQLGRGSQALPEELRSKRSVGDFHGHTLEAFALRNKTLRLGWTRAPAEDGGWFHTYLKRFPSLGLVAHLGFTGNGLPEENRLVALLELSFERQDLEGKRGAGNSLALGDVPPVLLSETWHDVHSIAAEGGGYDPDWEGKTGI